MAPPREKASAKPSVIDSVAPAAAQRAHAPRALKQRPRASGRRTSSTWAKRFFSPIGPARRVWRDSPAAKPTPSSIWARPP